MRLAGLETILIDERETVMLAIRGVYEVAIRVRDLPRSEAFYREVLDWKKVFGIPGGPGCSYEPGAKMEWWCSRKIKVSGHRNISPSPSPKPISSELRKRSGSKVSK